MKKRILLFIIAFISIGTEAQNFGFETWNKVNSFLGSQEDPANWVSLNVLNILGTTDLSVKKETVNPNNGTASASITTVKVVGASIPNPFQPGKNLDVSGILAIGKLIGTTLNFGNSSGFSQAHNTLSFASKYTPAGAGDSAFVLAFLTKYNSTNKTKDTIASGLYKTGATTTSYASNSLTLTYKPAFVGVIADSVYIFISSSVYSHPGAVIGSTFYVDDFAWSTTVGINSITTEKNTVAVFPNPATDNITFNSTVNVNKMEVTDITGRLVGTYIITDNRLTLQTSNFSAGIYLFSLLNEKQEVVNRGKFEVTK